MNSTDRKLRVFLCHASQDKPVVRELYQRLLAEGWIDPWLDEEKLLPGQDWDMEIEKAVRESDVVIICLSENSINKRGYVQKELNFALNIALEIPEGMVYIIPLRLDACAVPTKLTKWQWEDYYPHKRKNIGDRRLITSLRTRYAQLLGAEIEESALREKVTRANENMAIISMVAAEFAHKMNNLAGTIPVRIDMAESLLNSNDSKNAKIIEYLEKIRSESVGLLAAAKEIRESTEVRTSEEIDVNQLLEVAIARAEKVRQNTQSNVIISKILVKDLPFIRAERNSLLDTLISIIRNSIEAIDVQGTVIVKTRHAERAEMKFIEIEISDTGKGIPSSDLPKIFDLFYTTKSGKGLGFGLWRDKVFIRRLGGDIIVSSVEGEGSTFTIVIPTSVNQ